MQLPTEQDIASMKALELLAEAKARSEGEVSIGTIEKWFDGDQEACRHWLRRQWDRGYVESDGRLSAGQSITPDGLAYVETLSQRRADRGLRRSTCRSRILHWVDSNASGTSDAVDSSLFFISAHAWFEGEIFNENDHRDAIEYLVEHDLLHGIGKAFGTTFLRIGITHEGQECVTDFDSDVRAYLASKRQTPTTVSITGEGHTLALALGANSTATASTINIEAAVQLAQAVRQAADLLVLGSEGEQALADIEQRQDPSRVRRGLQWLAGFANETGAGALATVFGSVALRLLTGQ